MGHLLLDPRRPVDEHTALLEWTFLGLDQCERLHDALDRFVELDRRRDGRRWEEATFLVRGSSFFLASAASHFVAVLDADARLGRLPYEVHSHIRLVRNVMEHWQDWPNDWKSQRTFRERHAGVWPHKVHLGDGDFLIRGVVSILDLERALDELYKGLRSPSPARIYPPITEPIFPYPLG